MRMMTLALAALATWTCTLTGRAQPPPATRTSQPNIVFILVDDMRFDAMSCAGHPFARTPGIDRIAEHGVRFTNAFVTTSLCSPSRASLLTGMYAHSHGVRINGRVDPDPSIPTFPRLLQDAGYETAFIGKWHMQPVDNPRPGFDHWISFKGQGTYHDPELNENGKTVQAKGYITDLLTDYAVSFLRSSHAKPFCLCLWHKAVHGPFTPAPRHETLYADVRIPEPPNAGDDLADKPQWMRAALVRGQHRGAIDHARPVPPAMPPVQWDPQDPGIINWFRALAAVDDSVGRVLDTLSQTGLADRTVVIFASDNGFFHGEHRRRDKHLAFEESIRIPMLISGPGIERSGRTADQMVLNIDVAPTILDIAGLAMPESMQGRSLRPLLAGQSPPWRDAFLYEYFEERMLPGIPNMLAVRTGDLKYVRYPGIEDRDELYDLNKDPHELHNLAAEPGENDQLQRMRERLTRLLQETGYTETPGLPFVEQSGKLVLHYDFEEAGRRVEDGSANGLHTAIGLLKRVPGRSGNAAECDGRHFISVYKSPPLDPSRRPWTVTAWVKPASVAQSGIVLARGGAASGYALALRDGRPEFNVRLRLGAEPVRAAATESVGQTWVHMAGKMTTDRLLALYLDGRPVASADAAEFLTEEPFESMEICGDNGTQVVAPALPPFQGLVDDVRIFDGELTDEQIAELAGG